MAWRAEMLSQLFLAPVELLASCQEQKSFTSASVNACYALGSLNFLSMLSNVHLPCCGSVLEAALPSTIQRALLQVTGKCLVFSFSLNMFIRSYHWYQERVVSWIRQDLEVKMFINKIFSDLRQNCILKELFDDVLLNNIFNDHFWGWNASRRFGYVPISFSFYIRLESCFWKWLFCMQYMLCVKAVYLNCNKALIPGWRVFFFFQKDSFISGNSYVSFL